MPSGSSPKVNLSKLFRKRMVLCYQIIKSCYDKLIPLFYRLMGAPLEFQGVKKSSHVQLPARLVIAGGYTDTPPQCLMSPGRVFNIAI